MEDEANHSHPSSYEVKNTWRYSSLSQYVFTTYSLVVKKKKINRFGLFRETNVGKNFRQYAK